MQLELISFNLCPFVQRSVITLLYKDVAHTITYIDLSAKPDWFMKISPLGKVPLLRVNETTVLFESAVINEFIDETTGEPLHPSDPLLRASNRAWIQFGGSLFDHQYEMTYLAVTEAECLKHCDNLYDGFRRLEGQLQDGPYFNGTAFSLVDTSYAPLFTHIEAANNIKPLVDYTQFPKINGWRQQLLSLAAVSDSVDAKFNQLYRQSLAGSSAYYGQFVN